MLSIASYLNELSTTSYCLNELVTVSYCSLGDKHGFPIPNSVPLWPTLVANHYTGISLPDVHIGWLSSLLWGPVEGGVQVRRHRNIIDIIYFKT